MKIIELDDKSEESVQVKQYFLIKNKRKKQI